MRTPTLLLLLPPVFLSACHSQSPFDGTWIIDTGKNDNLANEKPKAFLVSDGMFRSADTVLKADGKGYSVPPTGYWDTVSVRIMDDHTVEVTSKKAGKPMFTETDTVSVDGNTLTQVVKDTTEAEAVTFENLYKRVASGPPGAHVLSGTWQVFKQSRSENSTIITYKCTSAGFSAETPLGEKFEAKFDGKFYLIEDDPARTMVAVKRINANTVEMTNQRDGKIVFVVRLEVMPDGKSIHASSKSMEGESVKTWELHKRQH
ncbi:MAG TPA: hypothetical protein VGR55_07955 [Candidatus Acidoferrum sp.]|nr:hypothetical protein [Candidatus Acidoferrum sp.]